jgi:hypothetical protein
MDMQVHYVRVPHWRATRPRWVWMSLGFLIGVIVTLSLEVVL